MITQDAFTSDKSHMGAIISKINGINKSQKDFFIGTIFIFLTIKGKINFIQMGRYSTSREIRFRNMFKKVFDFVSFNLVFIKKYCSDELLIGFDPSFLSKSGKYYSQSWVFLLWRSRNDQAVHGVGMSCHHRCKAKHSASLRSRADTSSKER